VVRVDPAVRKLYRRRLNPAFAEDFPTARSFCESCISIRDKDGELVSWAFNEEQAALDRDITGRDIVVKPRQIGITTYFAGRYLWIAIFREGFRCVLVAHEWDTAKSIKKRMLDVMLGSIDDRIRPPVRTSIRSSDPSRCWSHEPNPEFGTTYGFEFPWGSSIEVVYAGGKKGRGGTINCLHKTEAAFYGKDNPTAGLSECVPKTGEITTESTGDDPEGAFYQAVKAAERGEGNDRLHFFPWNDHEEYCLDEGEPMDTLDEEEERLVSEHLVTIGQLRWRRWKLSTAEMRTEPGRFEREYPLTVDDAFRFAGRPWFNALTVRSLELGLTREPPETIDLTELEGVPKVLLDWATDWRIYELPQKRHRYVLGADVAEGVDGAASAVIVLNATTRTEAARFQSSRIPPYSLGYQVDAIGRWYRRALAGVERNNHGHTVLAALLHVLKYPNVYRHEPYHQEERRRSRVRSGRRITSVRKVGEKKNQGPRPGWPTDPTTRPTLFDDLSEVLDNGTIDLRSLTVVQELAKTQNEGGIPKPGMGSTGDLVIALAIAVQMLQRSPRRAPRAEDGQVATHEGVTA